MMLVEDTPLTYEEAMKSIDAKFWKEAITNEIQSIRENQTWTLTNLPQGCKPIGCKWIFKKRLRPNGTIEKYRAKLVAKGFIQSYGVDYFDVYAPVARTTTIRTL